MVSEQLIILKMDVLGPKVAGPKKASASGECSAAQKHMLCVCPASAAQGFESFPSYCRLSSVASRRHLSGDKDNCPSTVGPPALTAPALTTLTPYKSGLC